MDRGLAIALVVLLAVALPYITVRNVDDATTARTYILAETGETTTFLPSGDAASLTHPIAIGPAPRRYQVENTFGADLGSVRIEAVLQSDLPPGVVLEAGLPSPSGLHWTTVLSPDAARAGITSQTAWSGPGWYPMDGGRVNGTAASSPPSWASFRADDPDVRSEPATRADVEGFELPGASVEESLAEPATNLPTLGLRGDIRLLFTPVSSLRIGTVDNNVDAGADGWDFTIAALDGRVVAQAIGYDDGVTTKTRKASQAVVQIEAQLQAGHWYVLTAKARSFDSVVSGIGGVHQGFFIDDIYLGGESWSTSVPRQFSVHLDSPGGLLQAYTPVDAGLQSIRVERDDGWNATLVVQGRRVPANLTLEPGQYRVTVPQGHVRLTNRGGLFGTEGPVALPDAAAARADADGVVVENALRGNPTLWTFASTPDVLVTVRKQDLNWRNGDDNLTVVLRDPQAREVARAVLTDDGDVGNASRRGAQQEIVVRLTGASAQAYRIEFRGSGDYLLRHVEVNQPYLVASSLFLIGDHPCCFSKLPRLDNGITLTYGSLADGNLSASTPHASGLQAVHVRPLTNGTSYDMTLAMPAAPVRLFLPHGVWSVEVPVQDVVLEGVGYFAFTRDSFFFPFLRERLAADGEAVPTHFLQASDPASLAQASPGTGNETVIPFNLPGNITSATQGIEVAFRLRGKGAQEGQVLLRGLTVTLEPKPLRGQAWWAR